MLTKNNYYHIAKFLWHLLNYLIFVIKGWCIGHKHLMRLFMTVEQYPLMHTHI